MLECNEDVEAADKFSICKNAGTSESGCFAVYGEGQMRHSAATQAAADICAAWHIYKTMEVMEMNAVVS